MFNFRTRSRQAAKTTYLLFSNNYSIGLDNRRVWQDRHGPKWWWATDLYPPNSQVVSPTLILRATMYFIPPQTASKTIELFSHDNTLNKILDEKAISNRLFDQKWYSCNWRLIALPHCYSNTYRDKEDKGRDCTPPRWGFFSQPKFITYIIQF